MEQSIKNKQRRIVNVWIIITLVFITGIFSPRIIGIDGMDGGFAISTLCALMVITGIIVIIFYNIRARRLDKLLNNKNIIARWEYAPEEWMKFTEYNFAEDKKIRRGMFKVVTIIAIVIGVILTLMMQSIIIAYVMIGIIIIVSIPAFLGPVVKHNRNLKNKGIVLISENSVFLNGEFFSWNMSGAMLDSVEKVFENDVFCLLVKYNYPTRTGIQTDEIRIPVPKGKENEADTVINSLK